MITNTATYDVISFAFPGVLSVQAGGLMVPGSLELSPAFEFDTPTAAGVDGAYVIFKGYKPSSWSCNMLCYTKQHVADYENLIKKVGPKPGLKNRPRIWTVRNGWFIMRDILQVYVTEITTLKKEGSGAFSYTIKGVEYRKVKRNPVVPIVGPTGNEYRDREAQSIGPDLVSREPRK